MFQWNHRISYRLKNVKLAWLALIALTFTFASNAQSALPLISEFTSAMSKKDGMIPVYYDETKDTVYLAVPHDNPEYLFQSSLPHGVGSNDIGLDRGQLGDTRLVTFERYGNKLMLKQLNTRYRAAGGNAAEQKSIDEAFADSVLAGFTVVASDDSAVLIDYTPYLLSDIHGISTRLSNTKQGTFSPDAQRSAVYLPRTKSFEKKYGIRGACYV